MENLQEMINNNKFHLTRNQDELKKQTQAFLENIGKVDMATLQQQLSNLQCTFTRMANISARLEVLQEIENQ